MTEPLADFILRFDLDSISGVDAPFDGAKLGGELVSLAHR
jgi:hypothetical protein